MTSPPEPSLDDAIDSVLLPKLSLAPTAHPACCLALSLPLLAHIHAILPPAPHLALSIGSGYGLLEALLIAPPYNLNLVGVEVQPTSNRYLPPSNHRCVPGTRFLEPLAKDAKVWLFIYPKRVGLVDEYIKLYGTSCVEKIVWAGPKADWEDYTAIFQDAAGLMWDVDTKSADDLGGRSWETLAVASKMIPASAINTGVKP